MVGKAGATPFLLHSSLTANLADLKCFRNSLDHLLLQNEIYRQRHKSSLDITRFYFWVGSTEQTLVVTASRRLMKINMILRHRAFTNVNALFCALPHELDCSLSSVVVTNVQSYFIELGLLITAKNIYCFNYMRQFNEIDSEYVRNHMFMICPSYK